MPEKLFEIVSGRGETYKKFRNAGGSYTLEAHCKPIHYRDDWVNGPFLDIDESSKVEHSDYTLYDKLPFKLKVFKKKIGYEIESKRTGDKYIVELEETDGGKFIKSKHKKEDLEFEFQISSKAVRLYKNLKTDNAPRKFKWKVSEFAKQTFDRTPGALNFKDIVDAFDGDNERVEIATKKTKIDKQSFYWEEEAPRSGIKVDTDVSYYSSAADGIVGYSGAANWNNTHDAVTGTEVNAAGSTATIWVSTAQLRRVFLYFDTSGLPDSAVISAASLRLRSLGDKDTGFAAMKGTQADSLTTADFDSFTGSEYGHALWGGVNTINISFDATGIGDIVLDGITKICAREYTYDYLDSSPPSTYYNGVVFSEWTGTDYDPKLSITYTLPPILKVINEGINISETKNILRKIFKVINEVVNISETKNAVQGFFKVINEAVNISELKNKITGLIKVINEVVSIKDKHTVEFIPAYDGIVWRYESKEIGWDIVHNSEEGNNFRDDDVVLDIGAYGQTEWYAIERGFLTFDTSSIGAANIISAKLKLWPIWGGISVIPGMSFCIMKGTHHDVLVLDDFDAFEGSEYGHVDESVADEYNIINFNAQGFADINKTGNTKICIREYDHDYKDVDPLDTSYSELFYSVEQGAGYYPILEVTYSSYINYIIGIVRIINEALHISEVKNGIKYAAYRIVAITIKAGKAIIDKFKLRKYTP